MYRGCRTTWRYFIGIPYCHVRNILVFHVWRLKRFKIYLENKFEVYSRVRFRGWSRLPQLKLLGIRKSGRRKLVVQTVITSTILAYMLM